MVKNHTRFVFLAGCIGIGLAFGAGVLSDRSMQAAPKKAAVFPTVTAIQTVVEALRPFSNGGETDVAVFVWATGEVNVDVEIRPGFTIHGSGDSLLSAVDDLRKTWQNSEARLKPFDDTVVKLSNTLRLVSR